MRPPRSACALLLACTAACDPQPSATIVIWGNGGALLQDETDRFRGDEALAALVTAVERLRPRAAFALGDHAPDDAKAWSALRRQLAGLSVPVHLVRGDRDPAARLAEVQPGAERHRVVDLGRARFVLLAARAVWEEADMAFLDAALAGHEQRAGTYVLVHTAAFRDRPLASAPAGIDVRQPGSGYGNWNEVVAPRLAGIVHEVFCGEPPTAFVTRTRGAHGIDYFCCGIVARGGGPPFFLQLELSDGELGAIVPRVLPLDARDGWYRHVSDFADVLRRAEAGPPAQRAAALERMLAQCLAQEDWRHAAVVLRTWERAGLPLARLGLAKLGPGCWSAGLGAGGEASPGQSPMLLLVNDGVRARTVRMHWTSSDGGMLAYGAARAPESWEAVRLPVVVELPLAAGAETLLAFRADAAVKLERVDVDER